MKLFLKALSLMTVLMLALTGFAFADQYSVTANGYGGELELAVTIDNGTITAIELVNCHETNVVIDRAFPVIRDRIIDANSPAVDSVTAATFSSYAVKSAVADAMKQAGMVVPAITFANEAKPAVERAAESCDIVIVGGGPAGLAAAIAAKETNADAHVLVVEKLDILSGNGKFDMNFFDMINTEAQKAAGNTEWTVDPVAHFLEYKANSGETPERIQAWAEQENILDAWLRGMGVELNYNYGGTNHMAEDNRYCGEAIQEGLENKAFAMGAEIRTGTKGVDLVMDNGTCTGVIVTNNAGETYTINAKAVILATGGFCWNKELLAKYAPGYEVLNTSNQMGATGDFVPVFEKYGFKLERMGKMSVFANIIVPRRDLTGGADMNLLVNKNGELLPNKSGLNRYDMITSQPSGAAFYLTDTTGYNSFYRIRKHVGLGYYTEGATLAELANKLGIDAAGLEAAVAAFNNDAAAGTENAAIGAVPARPLDAEGPYYAVRVEAADHMTKGGVVANEKAQVLYEDGTIVNGLYAAGEVTWQSGGYSESVCFGKIAGENAAAGL